MTGVPSGRSQADLARWAADLVMRRGLPEGGGLHLTHWGHAEGCPLCLDSEDAEDDPSARCSCEPDLTLILHVHTEHERRIAMVVDGVAVPVAPEI